MTVPPRPAALAVFYGAERVGTVHDADPLAFAYDAAWLARPDAFALSLIALRPGRQTGDAVEAFFENLLPEGDLRQYLGVQRKASTLFGLLLAVAGDTAGAFVLLAEGQVPEAPSYLPTTWAALARTIQVQSAAALHKHGAGARISLAGAQDKASIALFGGTGSPLLPRGSAPSTHILKPDIRRIPKVYESAANEAIVMRAAAHCGLRTAPVFYEPHTRACVVERFDRFLQADGTLGRVVQYDFCQLSNTPSTAKYEKEGGPGIAQCADIVRRYSSLPALDLQALALWLCFNLFTGNNDSHAKNLSLYQPPGQGVRLTPCYDLMCTRIYPGLSGEFAFSVGGTALPGGVGAAQLRGLADQLGVQARWLQKLALDLAARLPQAVDRAVAETAPQLHPAGRVFADKLAARIKTLTRQAATRMAGTLAAN